MWNALCAYRFPRVVCPGHHFRRPCRILAISLIDIANRVRELSPGDIRLSEIRLRHLVLASRQEPAHDFPDVS
jgi:hypothetical protein